MLRGESTWSLRTVRLRSRFKWVFLRLLRDTAALALAKWWVCRKGAVVLTFHRVLSVAAAARTASPPGLAVSQRTFELLLRHLKEHYYVVDLAQGRRSANGQGRKIAITFDDGWEDNASTAFPIAAKLKIPITIFVCPALMEMPMPFWPEFVVALVRSAYNSAESMERTRRALTSAGYPQWAQSLSSADENSSIDLIAKMKCLSGEQRGLLLDSLRSCGVLSEDCICESVDRTMSWSQLIELSRAGVTFGSHTQRHEILTKIPLKQVEKEVSESKSALEAQVGDCSVFSYPNGDVSSEVRDAVVRSGYELAFHNSPGVWRKDGDPFLIPRINLCEETVTGPDGGFSPLAFDYRVFWNAFTHRGVVFDR